MKKRITAFLSVVFIAAFPWIDAFAGNLGLSAQSAVLMCLNSGEVLYSQNPDEKLSMASTTKIMTSLIALEAAMPNMEVKVTKEMVAVEGTSMGLLAGDSVSLRELVYGMLLQSGNDAANTVAHVLGGTPEGFATMMNVRAEEIGMENTNFVTASGLDDGEHYSTAYDMALLACECLRNPEFREICSTKSARLTYGNPPYPRTLTNHNRLLWGYEGAIGVKTGFTKKSGRCLVSAAERDGVILVAVTLNAPDDWNDHRRMLDYGFSVSECEEIDYDLSSTSVRVYGGERNSVSLKLSYLPHLIKRDRNYEFVVLLEPYVYAPVEQGDFVGTLLIRYGGETVEEIPIESCEAVAYKKVVEAEPAPQEEKGFFSKIIQKIKDFFVQR